jgi:putative CocE/NonD family hydrolase
MRRILLAPTLALALLAPAANAAAQPSLPTAARVAPAAAAAAAAAPGGWHPRPEQYATTVTRHDLKIRMNDGVVLRGDLTLPATKSGKPVTRRLPTIVTVTAYNKTVLGAGAGAVLAGADPKYLVKRGYAQLTVDARGTGSSEGVWGAFSVREAKDAAAVVAWAHRQRWSNGRVGMTGASYMGISQIFAAARHPAGLKAIFPQVPGADVYRDVVASGGQIDVGFIPLWLGLVTGTGLVPPAFGLTDPAGGFKMLLDHLKTAVTFTVPLMAQAILGGDPAYDGPFYRDRSPINVINKVRVPTFFVGGEQDLFQRGTPLLFERLRQHGVPTRMIWGPWDHLQGSSGAEVPQAGYGTLAELQLRWFDHYVRGQGDARLLKDIKPLTYFEQGTDRWVHADQWIGRDLHPVTFRLSGTSSAGGRKAGLTLGKARAGSSVVPPIPVTGLCTRSANQWTAGVPRFILKNFPCFKDNRLNDVGGVVFQSAPLKRTLRIQGPINARLYASTLTGDGMLSVAVEDVGPNGQVTRLTGGWQVLAQRQLDKKRSRFLDGRLIQPYHPFTRASKAKVARGKIVPVDVEIFPTGAALKPGHRLRLSVQAFDIPHLLSPLPDLPGQLSPLTVHVSKRYPSVLTLPVR